MKIPKLAVERVRLKSSLILKNYPLKKMKENA